MILLYLIQKKFVNIFLVIIHYIFVEVLGLGKTHLLNAIGLELQNNNNVMFISAERFMYHFIKSIKKNDMVNFKDFLENHQFL